jgi:ArsR family transcriptional regulator, arsenate/arsenite/antimonite-responsive transcriptional repressor
MVKKIEKIIKALADKNRLRIVNMLSQRPMCVCEITEVLSLSQSTVSGHLRVLKDADLVEDTKDGLWVEYCLNKDDSFKANLLDLILDSLSVDKEMEKEQKKAKAANRENLCAK